MTVTLGKNHPQNFRPMAVAFIAPDGEELTIKVTFKYRTRKQLGEYLDQLLKEGQEKAAIAEAESTPPIQYMEDDDGTEPGDDSMEQMFGGMNEGSARFLVGCVAEWDVSAPISQASAEDLANEYPAAANALMEAYRVACRDGRLGN